MIPEPVKNFIDSFSRLPALGPRMATRLAFHLLNLDLATFKKLESGLINLKTLNKCGRCFFLKETRRNLCSFCADPKRDKSQIAIVEKETDLLSIEKTGRFKGQYLILGELPERGILETSQKLRLKRLKERIEKELGGSAKEIIIAVAPNNFGDFVADLISREFNNLAAKISRLGRGIPTGGEIEFADPETLTQALERRT